MRKTGPILACAVLLFLVPLTALAGPLQDDLKARRARAMERLGPDAVAIFWSAPVRVFSTDVDYEYRQDSNLLYLTGIDQEDTILVLMPGNETRKEMLFVREADARREHWNGHSLTPAEARHASGIQTVMTVESVRAVRRRHVLEARPGGRPHRVGRGSSRRSSDGRAKLALLLEPQVSLSAPPGPRTSSRRSCASASSGSTSWTRRRSSPTCARSRPRTSRTCCARASPSRARPIAPGCGRRPPASSSTKSKRRSKRSTCATAR